MLLNTGMTLRVSISAPCHRDRCSRRPLSLPSEENPGETAGEEGEPPMTSRGACQYGHVVRCLLTFTSSGQSLGGHDVWGRCYPRWYLRGDRRRILFSQNRPKGYLCRLYRPQCSFMTQFSQAPFDKPTHRNALPQETRLKTFSCVWLDWGYFLQHLQELWKSRGAGMKQYGMPISSL